MFRNSFLNDSKVLTHIDEEYTPKFFMFNDTYLYMLARKTLEWQEMTSYNILANHILLPFRDYYGNTKIKDYYSFLCKSQYWDGDKLIDFQNKRLRYIINTAYKNVYFYHNYFKSKNIDPNNINKVEDLKLLPIINKRIIKNNYNHFLNMNEKYKERTTSGTTGSTFLYRINLDVISMDYAIALRSWGWNGYNLGDKMIKIGGLSIINPYNFSIRNYFMRYKVIPTKAVHKNTLLKLTNYIKNYKPRHIHGFPSAIFILAKYMQNNDINIPSIKSILTSSEKLSDTIREVIKNVFNSDVIDMCGSSDGGEFFSECKSHKGYHIGIERSIHEFVDKNDNTVENSEGRVIVTDLWNTSMPFIRYETNDLAAPSRDSCSCGKNLPLISNLLGRVNDLVELNDGSYLSGLTLGDIFESPILINKIADYQIIQEDVNKFTINIVLENNILNKIEFNAIENFFNNYLNNVVELDLKYMDEIDRTDAGKRKIFISKIIKY